MYVWGDRNGTWPRLKAEFNHELLHGFNGENLLQDKVRKEQNYGKKQPKEKLWKNDVNYKNKTLWRNKANTIYDF